MSACMFNTFISKQSKLEMISVTWRLSQLFIHLIGKLQSSGITPLGSMHKVFHPPAACWCFYIFIDFHIPVWRWTRSAGGAAFVECSLCLWNKTLPTDGGPPGSLACSCCGSPCCPGCPPPPRATSPGRASFCPQILLTTPLLVWDRTYKSIISSESSTNHVSLLSFQKSGEVIKCYGGTGMVVWLEEKAQTRSLHLLNSSGTESLFKSIH